MTYSFRLHPRRDVAIIMSTESRHDLMTIEHPRHIESSIRQRRLFAIRNGSALIDKLIADGPPDWARRTPDELIAVFISDTPLTTERDFTDRTPIKGTIRSVVALGLMHWKIAAAADRFDVKGFLRRYDGIAVAATHDRASITRSWLPSELGGAERISLAELDQMSPEIHEVISRHFRRNYPHAFKAFDAVPA